MPIFLTTRLTEQAIAASNQEEPETLDETKETPEPEKELPNNAPPIDPKSRLENVSSATEPQLETLPAGWKVVKDSFPDPKIRQEVIQKLVEYIRSEDYTPKPVIELKEIIADGLNFDRHQVQSIVVNLFQAQCFLNEKGAPIVNHNEPIFGINNVNTKELEYKYVVNFLNRLYIAMPQAFTNPALIEATLGIKLHGLPNIKQDE
jgi:hypothetical protein